MVAKKAKNTTLRTPTPKKAPAKINVNKRLTKDKYFYLSNGGIIRNLHDLEKNLEEMNEELFCHHVNDSSNDFANWVNDVFGFGDLADQIRECEKNKDRYHHVILKFIVRNK
ncbi:hypothetical protein GOV05_05625 [Candidatus Woesearchaeota archaeon]|nr:hypothetical protein [Candidatus Woesearchaeota archaeon]